MKPILLVVVLALGWAGITGSFNILNLLLGAGMGVLAALLLRQSLSGPMPLRRLRRIVSLTLLFLYELGVSAIKVAKIVLTPDLKSVLNPAIVAVPLSVTSDAEIALLANLITLTPGTLSVDVSDDRRTLYVHVLALSSRDELIAEIANGFERKVKEVFA